MLESLSVKLQKVMRDLRGESRVSAKHLEAALREVRLALLEADVNFKVVKEFIEKIRAQALGQEVMQALTPAYQVIKIVMSELVALLGGDSADLHFANQPPTVILLVGLQGSGKTTTSGKLALMLNKQKQSPLLLPVDVYRPAAIEQLQVIGKEIGVPVYTNPAVESPVELCRLGITQAKNMGYQVVLVDTAGRLHVDEALMNELRVIKANIKPDEVLLVCDAMTGQDAVKSAQAFHENVGLTGVILTKLDGDARGGAALSIKSVIGQPIKFIGIGEKYSALEKFYPDRLANRILGMGDMLSFIEKAEDTIREEDVQRLAEKIEKDAFTLEDLREQIKQLRKMGSLRDIIGMLPNVGPLKGMNNINVDDKQMDHMEAIINSMTRQERRNYKLIDGSRRKRIARGCGRPVQEINQLLKNYDQMRRMMKGFKGKFGRKLMGKLPF
ncbi:MAG: signal recognition particle protein [Acidobacteria bacterium]|nr:signal recognition particle protein [Acidobacteriota bacterium]MBI3658387.1 signal recognition particle protein [Acidobacteriota bacterium]